jgi:multidrug efflux system membrane fusion protein
MLEPALDGHLMHTPAEQTVPELGIPSAPGTSPPRRWRRYPRRRYLIGFVVLLVSAVLFWWLIRGLQGTKRPLAAPPVTVVAATAQQANMPVYLDAIGTVTPLHTALITSQVNGQVMAVHYQEGQLVHRGTPLVDIDPRPFEATLLQAEGLLERDLQVLAQAKMDLERFRAAWARNAIAKQLLDDQEKLVLQTEGTVKNDRGIVKFDEVQVSFCHIVAPFTGRIGLRLVDPGNVVTATSATTLAVITQVQPITVVFTISEDDLSEVLEQTRRGARLEVTALDRVKSKKLAAGTLTTIDNQIDTTTGTVKLRALFDNADEALFPNQFVNTRLLVRTVDGAIIVPSSAVQHDGLQTFLYVIQNAHAHVQHVKTGVIEGDSTQVDGIAPGTVVANSSFEKLQDGAAVVLASPVAARGPSAPGGPAP